MLSHTTCESYRIPPETNIMQILLERGADVNAQGGFYGNALLAARSGGNYTLVQMLLERGADQSTPDILSSKGLKTSSDPSIK
ncbi:hypothetical protein N7540_010965 [Penicillium herquei]|nr:hypothetical protein N7540_010965 [Penicillium herquei]